MRQNRAGTGMIVAAATLGGRGGCAGPAVPGSPTPGHARSPFARYRQSSTTVAAAILGLAALLPSLSTVEARDRASVALEVRGNRLSLRTDEAPLAGLLERLATAGGITLLHRGAIDGRITVDLVDVSFEEAIRRLLREWNFVVLYDRSSDTPSVIHVLGRGGAGLASPTPGIPGAPGKAGDEVDVAGNASAITLKKLAALQPELQAILASEPRQASRRLQDLLADDEASVRITALQGLAGSRDELIEALVGASRDSDSLVQGVVMQILLDREVGHEDIAAVMAAGQAQDPQRARLMLNALLAW